MAVRLLGALTVENDQGRRPRLPTRKTSLLVAALAVAGDRGFRREALAELVWPDRGDAQARASLRQALTAVRRLLSETRCSLVVVADAERVELTGADGAVDVWSFDKLADSSDVAELVHAAGLYGGDLLEDVALDGQLERWIGGYRAAFHRRALALAERLSILGGHDEAAACAAETLANCLLARDAAAEEAHRALIRICLARGQSNAARRQLERCRAALMRELEATPEPATLALLDSTEPESAVPAGTRPAVNSQTSTSLLIPGLPGATRSGPSLVIMPFDNLSGPDDTYFVDGVVEEITSVLSRIREFFVVARQSAFTYKGRFVDVREVGRELGVRYVIEGTVRRGGERVRISVQLVDAETRTQLWSDRYEGETADIFSLQDAIASQVAGAIHPTVRASEIEAARRKPPGSLEAYDFLLRALPHFWAHTREDNRKAIGLLDEALRCDPDYGDALAFSAWCHAQQACYLWSGDPARDQSLAVHLAERAARHVEDHATALIAIGAAYGIASTDQDRAASYIDRALKIDPNNAWGWMRLGWVRHLSGRPDEAIEHFERALILSPLDPFAFNVHFGLSAAWRVKGDYAKAIALVERGLRANPGAVWAYRLLAANHAMAGNDEEAERAVETFLRHYPDATIETVRAAIPPSLLWNDPQYLQGLEKAGLPRR